MRNLVFFVTAVVVRVMWLTDKLPVKIWKAFLYNERMSDIMLTKVQRTSIRIMKLVHIQ